MANLSFEQLLAQHNAISPFSTTNHSAVLQSVTEWQVAGHSADLFDQAKQYIQRAIKNADLPAAERAVTLAWLIANHTQAAADRAQAHWCAGMFHANRHVQQALDHAQAALAFFQESGDAENQGRILIGIASQLNLLGRLSEAEKSIKAAASLLSTHDTYRDWPVIYINLSYIQCQQGNYQSAVASAAQAIQLAQRLLNHYPERRSIYLWQEAQALVNQGRALLHLADFATAQVCLQQAFLLADEQAAGWIAGRAAIHLARLHGALGQLVVGLQWAQRAQQRFQAADIQIDLATAAIEEAHLYTRLKMLHLARQAARYAADAFAQADIPTESVEARLLAVRLSLLLREPRQAKLELLAAQPLLPHTPPLLQHVWRAYQVHYRLLPDTSTLVQAYAQVTHAASALLDLGAEQEALEVEIIAAELSAALQPLQAVCHFAHVAERAYKLGIPHVEQHCYELWAACLPPAEAIAPLQKAVQIVNRLQQAISFEELKANLLTGHTHLYSRLAETQLAVGQPLAALQTLLAAKGAIWAEVGRKRMDPQPLPDWQQARAELDFWQDELREAVEPDFIALCKTKIGQSQQALAAAARTRLAAEPPTITADLPEVATLLWRLPAEAVAIEFLCGAERIWACVIDAQQPPQWIALGAHAVVQPLLSALGLLLATMQRCPVALRGQTAAGQQATIMSLLQQLHALLWQPLTAAVQQAEVIYLAPHDYLFELPWSALWDGTAYLGQTQTLCLLPSVSVMATPPTVAHADAHTVGTTDMLLLGHCGEPPLQFVEAELQAIAQIYPTAALEPTATTTAFAWASPPHYLHLAVHGAVNRREPLFSRLHFADGDYLLVDVLHLNLRGTRLVTLSACETSTVPEQGGVLLALAGAFLSAGAQSTVATLWQVDDQATQLLMQQFYQGLRAGLSIPHALRGAQQTVYHAGYQHPYYWAAFQPLSRELDQPVPYAKDRQSTTTRPET